MTTAAEMLEQNAASQAVNVAFRKHQHFDWTELGVSGITGGVLGGNFGDKVNKTLGKLDHNTGILRSEFQALTFAGAQSATTGGYFNATQVFGDSLGSALGNALVNAGQSPVLTNAMAALSLEDDLNDMHAAFNNFRASQLSGHDGYNESQPNQSYEYSSIPVAENYSAIPEQENYSSIPKSEFYEYSAIPNPDAATARSNGVMHMSVSNAFLESHLAGLGLLLESSSSTCKSIPMDNAFLIEKSEIKLNKIKHFDLDDARNGLRQVYDQYGAEMSKVVEKMYRYETKHFTSAQYVLTGTAGMEASHGSKAPYYGWSSDFFKEYPEYTPIGTTGLHDGIGISKQGGNKQKKGITQYIQFPSVEAGMLHLAYKIKNTYHGNFARWHSTTPSHQQSYKDGLKYVRWDITKNLIKES